VFGMAPPTMCPERKGMVHQAKCGMSQARVRIVSIKSSRSVPTNIEEIIREIVT
jgi:hypothetical protein